MEIRCQNPRCRRILIDAAKRGVHPTPECDPSTEWWLSPEDLAELAALYPPRTRKPAQEADPQ
jgi:hypothetical protein